MIDEAIQIIPDLQNQEKRVRVNYSKKAYKVFLHKYFQLCRIKSHDKVYSDIPLHGGKI